MALQKKENYMQNRIPDCYGHLKLDCRLFDARKDVKIEQPYDQMLATK